MMQKATQHAAQQGFKRGDFVLYRDPARYWTGQPNHTFVCQITFSWHTGEWNLRAVETGVETYRVSEEYMRLLPAAEAMVDIDTAPLRADNAAAAMDASALAWLVQNDPRRAISGHPQV